MKKYKYCAILTIAGSDSGGGAGIQADLKTFSALGCFGTSAITAITVQNTTGVTAIHPVPAGIVAGQIRAVMDDIKPMAIKIGMVHSVELAIAIAESLRNYPEVPVILDPVMVSASGDRLIEYETIETLKTLLFPLATIVTPNLDETGVLTGTPVTSLDQMKDAADQILMTGCRSVLIKGGHLAGLTLYNVFKDQQGDNEVFPYDAIDTNNTHGTGCSLSSAIAAFIARGERLKDAVKSAGDYIHRAIEEGTDVITGKGHGPLNHFYNPQPLLKYELE